MGDRWLECIGIISAFVLGFAAFAAHADELKCEGPFAKDSDHQRLVSLFGQRNVVKSVVHEESEQMNASTIFPKDPARSVEVVWWNGKARKRPSSIQTSGSGWIGPKGIRVGMALSEVEALNGRPFTLYGFGWDFGGTSSDWKGGELADLPSGCNLIVIFSLDETASEGAQIKVSSDNEFASNQNEIKAVKPRVARIGLGFPQKP
jgi:hypothetical protein